MKNDLEHDVDEWLRFVEMDIVLTKDNKFVVSHDFNLKRLGNKNSYIRNLNLNEIDGVKTRQNGFESEFISFDKYAKKAKELRTKATCRG